MSTAALFVPHGGCDYRCSFCNQNTISGADKMLTPSDVTAFCETVSASKPMELAFFGGSFTCIQREVMVSLLEAAQPFVENKTFTGIRLSTRPDGLGAEVLDILRRYRVTTIEIGAQSMFDCVLRANGRFHTAKQVADSAKRVQDFGFSLGLQMMTGLYQSTADMDMETARRLAALAPEGVRIYPTAVLRGSGLERLLQSGVYTPPNLWESVALCADILLMFEERGIPVWRMGLHASPELEKQVVGGTYHPAFRELCEGRLLFCQLEKKLLELETGAYTVSVCPKSISKIYGHGQKPLAAARRMGYNIKIKTDPAIQRWRDFTILRGDV